jgi:myo-inositol-1(or 4)-monophosphatase
MTAAARKAGKSLTRDFNEVEQLQVSVKGPANFVSAADHRAEEILFNELSKSRPGYGFVMEERGHVEGADKSHRWIIDPLDGTTNFLHSIPIFAISIALERDGDLVAGVIYNPVMDETYTAEKGKGAFLNDRRLRVANRRKLEECVIATGIPYYKGGHQRFLDEVGRVMARTAGVRRCGAAAIDLA